MGRLRYGVGEKVTSVFCGAADKDSYNEVAYHPKTNTYHPVYDSKTLALHHLYQQVRDIRESHNDYPVLANVWRQLQLHHPQDWLCAMEILEILHQEDILPTTAQQVRDFLENKMRTEPELEKLIADGFYLIDHPVEQNLVSH